LFNHPNVGPFIGKQLIQRLVTSNPSPAYVARVSAAFADNGQGVRGDMKAVLRAILLDSEARDDAVSNQPSFGRVREPILRMTHLMRVFGARTDADPYDFGISMWLYDRRKGLWQTPLGSPTVFNFFRVAYTPPGSELARRQLVAPELQLTTLSSVGDLETFLRDLLQNGGIASCCSEQERNTFTLKLNYAPWLASVNKPGACVDRLANVFLAGRMPPALKRNLVQVMQDRWQSSSETSGMQRGVNQIKLAEAVLALLLAPEYVVQK
jgi:Protein of unknown function (DUF1800)